VINSAHEVDMRLDVGIWFGLGSFFRLVCVSDNGGNLNALSRQCGHLADILSLSRNVVDLGEAMRVERGRDPLLRRFVVTWWKKGWQRTSIPDDRMRCGESMRKVVRKRPLLHVASGGLLSAAGALSYAEVQSPCSQGKQGNRHERDTHAGCVDLEQVEPAGGILFDRPVC